MTRLTLLTAFFAVTTLTGAGAISATAADFGGEPYRDNAQMYAQRNEVSQDARRAPNTYDEDYDQAADNHRPYGGWGGGYGIQRVEATASYRGSSLPYQVKEWRARESAIDAWKSIVAIRYGERFAYWRSATDKQISCDAGAGSVYCSVSARPARSWGGWGSWWGSDRWGRRASY